MTAAALAAKLQRGRTGARVLSAGPARAQSSAQVEARAISALSLAWGGSALTDFDSQPLNGDHELSLRFMAAYEAAFRGVLLADESGTYRVGLAPYASFGAAALEVRVGGAILTYPLPASTLGLADLWVRKPPQPQLAEHASTRGDLSEAMAVWRRALPLLRDPSAKAG